MNHDVPDALETMARVRNPRSVLYIQASHSTFVEYLGITGRSRLVQILIVHPPCIGDYAFLPHDAERTAAP